MHTKISESALYITYMYDKYKGIRNVYEISESLSCDETLATMSPHYLRFWPRNLFLACRTKEGTSTILLVYPTAWLSMCSVITPVTYLLVVSNLPCAAVSNYRPFSHIFFKIRTSGSKFQRFFCFFFLQILEFLSDHLHRWMCAVSCFSVKQR